MLSYPRECIFAFDAFMYSCMPENTIYYFFKILYLTNFDSMTLVAPSCAALHISYIAIAFAFATCRNRFPGLPLFVMGHSMGAAICALAAGRQPDLFSGVLLSRYSCDNQCFEWGVRSGTQEDNVNEVLFCGNQHCLFDSKNDDKYSFTAQLYSLFCSALWYVCLLSPIPSR